MSKKWNDKRVITVEQRHIDEAMPESSAKCMIAEAVRESYPGSKRIHVDMQTIRYTDAKGVRRTYLTSTAAQHALVRFDAGDPVDPFRFMLHDLIHINRPHNNESKKKRDARASGHARVGGRPVVLGNATRRRFGIRNLRINAEGQVVQAGTVKETE